MLKDEFLWSRLITDHYNFSKNPRFEPDWRRTESDSLRDHTVNIQPVVEKSSMTTAQDERDKSIMRIHVARPMLCKMQNTPAPNPLSTFHIYILPDASSSRRASAPLSSACLIPKVRESDKRVTT